MTTKQAGPGWTRMCRAGPGRARLLASVCPDPDCVKGRILFSPEKASATVRIPASTQHTNGLFEDYSNVCLCSPPPPPPSPPPSAPTHRSNLHFGRNKEKGQERRKKGQSEGRVGKGREGRGLYLGKQLESNTTLSCAPI